MGRVLVEIIRQTPGAHLAGAIEQPGSIAIGQDAGLLAGCGQMGVPISGDALTTVAGADGILDFTTPESTIALAALAAQARIVHVIGTTGLGADHLTRLEAAARHAVVVRSGNMSLGVNVLAALVKRAAATLGPDYDIEILEMHHRHKVDAPSGTALLLGKAAAEGRGIDLGKESIRSRDGHTGARPSGAIGFSALRGGSVVGDHTVIFSGEGERIEFTHRAESRDNFAKGAIRA
ncbi:MAG: 4-hydroxy-tetrahydrodipicolinate reductase, partial [Burkholderiales bacterium]